MKQLSIELTKQSFLPGDKVTGYVLLNSDKTIEFREFFVELLGSERTVIRRSSGGRHHHHHTYRENRDITHQRIPLETSGQIMPGSMNYQFEFQLPYDALPSYQGHSAQIAYVVHARIDVPMWFDVTETVPIYVYTRRDIGAGQPITINEGFPMGSGLFAAGDQGWDKPGFVINIPKSTYYLGETIQGDITVRNPTTKRIRKIELVLEAVERAVARGHTDVTTINVVKHNIPFDDSYLERPIPFTIQTPQEGPSHYRGTYSKLSWMFGANLDIAWARDREESTEVYIYR